MTLNGIRSSLAFLSLSHPRSLIFYEIDRALLSSLHLLLFLARARDIVLLRAIVYLRHFKKKRYIILRDSIFYFLFL